MEEEVKKAEAELKELVKKTQAELAAEEAAKAVADAQ